VVVVTGANGFIGRNLVAAFVDRGWTVRALVRQAPSTTLPGVEFVHWELGKPAGTALSGAWRLVHAAAVPYNRADASQLNVVGTRHLLGEARESGVAGSVFLSSMSAHARASSAYGRDKRCIAAMFDGPEDFVVRPGLVLGEGGLFGRILGYVTRRPIVPLIGGGHQQFQTVFVEDLAEAIALAISIGLTGTVTVAEPIPVRFGTLLKELATMLGKRRLFVPIPYAPTALAIRAAARMKIALPVSSDNLFGLRELETFDVAADLARLGIEVRDYRASLRTILQDGQR